MYKVLLLGKNAGRHRNASPGRSRSPDPNGKNRFVAWNENARKGKLKRTRNNSSRFRQSSPIEAILVSNNNRRQKVGRVEGDPESRSLFHG